MDCQYGVHYKKPKQPKEPNQTERIYLQGTRKQGCLAHVEIREFLLYPEYSIDSLLSTESSMKQVCRLKEEITETLFTEKFPS